MIAILMLMLLSPPSSIESQLRRKIHIEVREAIRRVDEMITVTERGSSLGVLTHAWLWLSYYLPESKVELVEIEYHRYALKIYSDEGIYLIQFVYNHGMEPMRDLRTDRIVLMSM